MSIYNKTGLYKKRPLVGIKIHFWDFLYPPRLEEKLALRDAELNIAEKKEELKEIAKENASLKKG